MHRTFFTAIGLCLTQFSALSAEDLAPPNLNLATYILNGSGCTQSNVASSLSPDGEALTLIFSDFFAESVDGLPNSERRICNLRLDLQSEQAWQYAVVGLEMRGFAFADQGAKAFTRIKYRNPEGQIKNLGVEDFEGPFDDFYIRSHKVQLKNLPWYGCQASTRLDLQFAVQANSVPGSESLITVDSVDAEIEQSLALVWRPCHAQGKKRFLGTCHVRAKKMSDNASTIVREVLISAQAFSKSVLREKLKRKYEKRCSHPILAKKGLRCAPIRPKVDCELTQLD